jgi:hypothetical protein
MRVEVSKCSDCPCLHFEEEGGPICNHPQMMELSQLDYDEISEGLPRWCPLIEEELTIGFRQKDNS